jgi:Tfp pilus assembly protein PilN
MATSINLAPGTQYLAEARARRRRLFILSGVIAVGMVVVWLGLVIYQIQIRNSATSTTQQIQQVNADISKLDSDSQRIVLFESRLNDLTSLLNTHVTWAPLFTAIEQLIPSNATVTGVDVSSGTGLITITGQTPDVDTVASSLTSLSTNQGNNKTIFTSATLSNITRNQIQGVNGAPDVINYKFAANFSFDPKIIQGLNN